MLIAVTGVGPGTGATTTALSLAVAWPTQQPVIVVDADPRGGRLARECGGDPARGLASLTTTTGPGAVLGLAELGEHLQWHRAGIAYLAAPTQPEDTATALAHPIVPALSRIHQHSGELVVIADCGPALSNSVPAPLLCAADLVVLLIPVSGVSALLARSVRQLAHWCPQLVVVSIGAPAPHGTELAAALGAPILGWLPRRESLASELVHGRTTLWSSDFGGAAHTLAAAVRTRATGASVPATSRGWSSWRRGDRTRRDHTTTPRVYAISARRLPSGTAHHQPGYPVNAVAAPPTSSSPQHPAPPSAPPALITAPGPVHQPAPHHHPIYTAPSAPHTGEPVTRPPSLALGVFGPLRVMWRPPQGASGHPAPEVEITARLQRRTREVLALLATHPQGLTRAQLIDALWGPHHPQRPTNALYTTLARLRTTIAEATGDTEHPLLDTGSRCYRLNPAAVSIDYTEFADALNRRRHATEDHERLAACTRIVSLAAAGTLAADLDAHWLDPIRDSARRSAITAIGALARTRVSDDPHATLRLLETGIDIDPHNEDLYSDILKLHARLEEHHAISDTMNLLVNRLAEIGEEPSKEIRHLAKQLCEKRSQNTLN